jgi:Tol biopolymer transport system component
VRTFLPFLFIALTILTACSPRTGPAAVPNSLSGHLLFTQRESLWTWALPNGEQQEIVPAPKIGQQITSARWSPDGTQVTYALFDSSDPRNAVSQVFLASPNGQDVRVILPAAQPLDFYQSPAWSPDGKSIYAMHSGGSGQQRINRIVQMSVATGDIETIADDIGFFDVSGDGRWLAMARSAAGGLSLDLLDLHTREWHTLLATGQFDNISAPRFDPTSTNLLFGGTVGARTASTSAESPLALGTTVAEAHGLPQDLYVIPIAGGQPKQVAALQADDPALSWSPDGQSVVVLWIDSISVILASGGQPTRILTPGSYGSVDWSR